MHRNKYTVCINVVLAIGFNIHIDMVIRTGQGCKMIWMLIPNGEDLFQQ